jgi:hypothetical protein
MLICGNKVEEGPKLILACKGIGVVEPDEQLAVIKFGDLFDAPVFIAKGLLKSLFLLKIPRLDLLDKPFERLLLPLAIDKRYIYAKNAYKRICLIFLTLSFSLLYP